MYIYIIYVYIYVYKMTATQNIDILRKNLEILEQSLSGIMSIAREHDEIFESVDRSLEDFLQSSGNKLNNAFSMHMKTGVINSALEKV